MDKRKKSKRTRILIIAALLLAVIISLSFAYLRYTEKRDIAFQAEGSSFHIQRNGEWEEFLIKGVNLGAGKPGYFPGEMGITKEEYARWFKQISDMNSNSIRVYTILGPAFYEALFEHNLYSEQPLYLFHGVWINEEAMSEYADIYHNDVTEDFKSEIQNLIDVLHGNKKISERPGHASGAYRFDVSPYVAGYILGIEMDASLVINTNELNSNISSFTGTYLYTEDASPHECWLASMGDFTIDYEMQNYGVQKPVSWVNWLTTDPLWHDAEPDAKMEDAVSVDTEHILPTHNYTAGLFASYHVYPYYPEFMMYQPEYISYKDASGEINPYEGYLRDLRAHHTVPLLIAEFGLPSSRGLTHENFITGYNQGRLTEQEQGEYGVKLFESIVASDCAGGLVFTWQDEWFKRSWNTMDFDRPERRPYWSNVQVSEQMYGLLGFDPGKSAMISHVDGDTGEWQSVQPLIEADGLSLSLMADERYLYLRITDSAKDASGPYYIAVDSVSGQGNSWDRESGLSLSVEAETLIRIDGEDNSAILVDAYYDTYYRFYTLLGIVPHESEYERKNSGIFSPMLLFLHNNLTMPLTGTVIPYHFYDTGKLRHGNSNPESDSFDSLSDFFISSNGGDIELRIPWQLLGVSDPSNPTLIGDIYANEYFDINAQESGGLTFELLKVNASESYSAGTAHFSWAPWFDAPTSHERLKQSYYIFKDAFARYGE